MLLSKEENPYKGMEGCAYYGKAAKAFNEGASAQLKKVIEWIEFKGVIGHNKDGAVEILLNPKDWQSLLKEVE